MNKAIQNFGFLNPFKLSSMQADEQSFFNTVSGWISSCVTDEALEKVSNFLAVSQHGKDVKDKLLGQVHAKKEQLNTLPTFMYFNTYSYLVGIDKQPRSWGSMALAICYSTELLLNHKIETDVIQIGKRFYVYSRDLSLSMTPAMIIAHTMTLYRDIATYGSTENRTRRFHELAAAYKKLTDKSLVTEMYRSVNIGTHSH